MAVSKGQQVRILRKESFWFREVGTVASVADSGKYPVNVRFTTPSYFGLQGLDGSNNTNNFAENELEQA
ncbi:photosystem I reaction center subunit IV [Prochlorococcus sp. MIT 1341]|uniref:photosystem I reaction center subunit IV n=1 Tax=Prochlorococcus sp. MIT 1341 TaxID=3096221 RepID=UPI002A762EED|nr:photosystem I reaction center subunit IV [Prochlorococcus sp. MIT 1341]